MSYGNELPREVEMQELQELVDLYMASDDWGRSHILRTARKQSAASTRHSAPRLRLVAGALVDKSAHTLDHVVNGFPLALIRQAVNGE